MENLEPKEAMNQARYIASLIKYNQISYKDAKKQCEPLLAIVNAKGSEIAKKYKKRFNPIRFAGLAR